LRTRTCATLLRAATLLCIAFAASSAAHAQADATAVQGLYLSAFGGATGTFTGLTPSYSNDQGRNLGITAGVDLGIRSFFHLHPAVEIRGTFPVDSGSVAGFKNVLGGVRVEKTFGRIHPYADFLFGRGEINYQGAGYLNPAGTLYYIQSLSNVYSFGGGADFDITQHYAFKADFQMQHYNVPVTTSGSLYTKAVTAAVVYRFDFNHHAKIPKR
jgi:hypothetical protein